MARAHYIVRVGNETFSTKTNKMVTNHWHYLSPQYLWALPKNTPQVNVRADFIADIANPQVTTYIWFLCNSQGGPGHFVHVGIGRRHVGSGPVADGHLPIPADVMSRLREGFDHWFNWEPVSRKAAFQGQLRRIPAPKPTYIPTLRHVSVDHPSLPAFEALVEGEEHKVQSSPSATLSITAAPSRPSLAVAVVPAMETDLENLRREQAEPDAQGFVYLVHMKGTKYYKIGMSLDPEIRLKTLQTGNPHNLRLAKTQTVRDMRSAESTLHSLFEAERVPNLSAREWFRFNKGISEVDNAFSSVS